MGYPTNSFEKFHYGLRPCKQIERKVMVEILLKLAKAEYDVSKYTYLGLGSPYFIDFMLFHKTLYIDEMVCLEWGDVPNRMKFNKPFQFIDLHMYAFGDYIQRMKKRTKYLAWVDFDRPLDEEMLADFSCLARMAPESIFIVTIEARPNLPRQKRFDTSKITPQEAAEFTLDVYREWFGKYVDEEITLNHLTPNQVPELFYRVARRRIDEVLTPRELQFHQLFNVLYADGALMLTIGGMIGTVADHEKLDQAEVLDHKFVRTGEKFLEITVPPLTFREKNWLDQNLKDGTVHPGEMQFEIKNGLLQNYCTFYREYPTYMEIVA